MKTADGYEIKLNESYYFKYCDGWYHGKLIEINSQNPDNKYMFRCTGLKATYHIPARNIYAIYPKEKTMQKYFTKDGVEIKVGETYAHTAPDKRNLDVKVLGFINNIEYPIACSYKTFSNDYESCGILSPKHISSKRKQYNLKDMYKLWLRGKGTDYISSLVFETKELAKAYPTNWDTPIAITTGDATSFYEGEGL